MIRLAPALVWLLALVSCAGDPVARVPRLLPAPDTVSARDVADRLDRALSSASALRVTERSFENGTPSLSSESWMMGGRVRSDIFEGGRLVYSLSIRDRRAQELIPPGATADGHRGPRFEEYELAKPAWIEFPRLVSVPWACRAGDAFGSWLGPGRLVQDVLLPRLASSRLLGTAEVSGVECAVLQWEAQAGDAAPPDDFRQGATYDVDLRRGWMLREDKYQQAGNRRTTRTVLRQVERADPPPELFELGPQQGAVIGGAARHRG